MTDERQSRGTEYAVNAGPHVGTISSDITKVVPVEHGPDGQPLVTRRLSGRAASDVADLASMEVDLRRALAMVERAAALRNDDPVLSSACWEAAVLAYGRCYVTGRPSIAKGQRRKMPEAVVTGLDSTMAETHAVLLEQRGKIVGHRVSGQVSFVYTVRHPDAATPSEIRHGSLTMLQGDNLDAFRDLIQHTLSVVQPLLQTEMSTLPVPEDHNRPPEAP